MMPSDPPLSFGGGQTHLLPFLSLSELGQLTQNKLRSAVDRPQKTTRWGHNCGTRMATISSKLQHDSERSAHLCVRTLREAVMFASYWSGDTEFAPMAFRVKAISKYPFNFKKFHNWLAFRAQKNIWLPFSCWFQLDLAETCIHQEP